MWRSQLALGSAWVGALLLGAVLGSRALAAAAHGTAPLGAVAPWVAAAIDAAGATDAGLTRFAARWGLAGSGLVIAGFAWARLRGRPLPGMLRCLGALFLAWTGHQLLVDGRSVAGVLLYVAAGVAYLLGAGPPRPLPRTLPARLEAPALLALLACFLLLAVHRLDVWPPIYFDEAAYATAARVGSGEIEPQPIRVPGMTGFSYTLERMRSQAVPFLLQAAVVERWPAGLLPLRLLSVAAALATLIVAGLAVRTALGAPIALGMLALAGTSTLALGYGRPAFYLAFSPLHAAACLAFGLRFARRRDAVSALALGALFASSFYLYQLSWFAPLLTGSAVVAAWPRLPAPRRSLGLALLAILGAAAVLLPGTSVLRDGFGQVVSQTFERAAWARPETESVDLLRPGATPAEANEVLADAQARGLRVRLRIGIDRELGVQLGGSRDVVEEEVAALEAEGWRVAARRPASLRWLQNAKELGALLLLAPGAESAAWWIGAPLLGPGVAALVYLGLLEVWRRRRDPMLRALLVWVAGAALLPGVLGGALPRRPLLIQPFVFALAALPLVAACATGPGARRRWLGAGAAGVALAAAAAAGPHAYFSHWYWQPLPPGPLPSGRLPNSEALDLVAWVNRAHADRLVLVLPVLAHTRYYLDLLEPEARSSAKPEPRILYRGRTQDGEHVRHASCGFPTPLSWIARTDQVELFEGLVRDFDLEVESRGPLLRVRLLRRRPGGCRDPAPGA